MIRSLHDRIGTSLMSEPKSLLDSFLSLFSSEDDETTPSVKPVPPIANDQLINTTSNNETKEDKTQENKTKEEDKLCTYCSKVKNKTCYCSINTWMKPNPVYDHALSPEENRFVLGLPEPPKRKIKCSCVITTGTLNSAQYINDRSELQIKIDYDYEGQMKKHHKNLILTKNTTVLSIRKALAKANKVSVSAIHLVYRKPRMRFSESLMKYGVIWNELHDRLPIYQLAPIESYYKGDEVTGCIDAIILPSPVYSIIENTSRALNWGEALEQETREVLSQMMAHRETITVELDPDLFPCFIPVCSQ